MCMLFVFGALLEFTLVNYLARTKNAFTEGPLACCFRKKVDPGAGDEEVSTRLNKIIL